jgi:predicted HAD superfamily phosphohydrolase YqeG
VLDLDETLVHWDENNETLEVRPYAEEFLQIMNKYYELVIFTAGV